MMNRGLYTSATAEWATPQAFFDQVSEEFGTFDLDVCATKTNTKVNRFFSAVDGGGLAEEWLGLVWMNPPYGREIGRWIRKAYESALLGATVVCLLPSRTDTAWWHDYVMKAREIRFIRGRLHFNDQGPAPFPSALVIF